ncbi:MAG: (Fe-S)-binding protein [Candidatus Jordarchaeum sp.]|uniref:(Fe-S)-binding protein n=1 Tax=Candidatus Jordarchaeum sp. TaxID=2823881 RepID=UPI00404AC9BF
MTELAYYAGCTAAYRLQNIARSSVKILKKLGVDFKNTGYDEVCCGSVLFNMGLVEEGIKLANKNKKIFKDMNIETLVTECAGCAKTFRIIYPEHLDFRVEVLHLTEYLERKLNQNNLELEYKYPIRVTYHDPCHLGRGLGVYDPPRNILKSINNLELVEMSRNRDKSRCCGAGGGVKASYPETAQKLGIQRLNDAEKLGVDLIITACPFCTRNLNDAAELCGSKLKTRDLSEFVSDCI